LPWISLAYVEENGIFLLISLLAAVIVLSAVAAAVWEIAVGTKWAVGLVAPLSNGAQRIVPEIPHSKIIEKDGQAWRVDPPAAQLRDAHWCFGEEWLSYLRRPLMAQSCHSV
jgi:hypothetical protein